MTSPTLPDNLVPFVAYTVQGTENTFTYKFLVVSNDDLYVYVNNVEVSKNKYTVTGIGSSQGGEVIINTLTQPLVAGDIVALSRNTLPEQITEFLRAGDFTADAVNAEFTRLYALMQEQDRDINNAQGDVDSLRALVDANDQKHTLAEQNLDLKIDQKDQEQDQKNAALQVQIDANKSSINKLGNAFGATNPVKPWVAGEINTNAFQRYFYPSPAANEKSYTWSAPLASNDNQVTLGASPIGDNNWQQWDASQEDITQAQEQLLPKESQIFPRVGDLQIGQTVPTGVTHLRVGGNVYAISPLVSGLVSDLSETGATIGGMNVRLSPKTPSTVARYGAVGDALISMSKPLYYLINGVEPLTRANATDDTQAIKDAIANESVVDFDGSKGYLVSDFITWSDANKRLVGNGAVIVYRGGRTPGLQGETPLGVFSPVGQVSSSTIRAVPTSGIDVFSNKLTVSSASNTLDVGDWFLFKGDNGVTDFATTIRKYAYYPAQVNSVTDLGNGNTEIEMSYKTGFSFSQSEITIGEFVPCDNPQVSGFRLLDEMPATPTPDILPVPQAPESERREALGLVYAQNVTNFAFNDLQSYKAKYSTCTAFTASNGEINNIRSFKPVWFGGGEGYAVRAISCCYMDTSSLSMLGGRHVIDWTTCGWCSHSGGNGETDQVSFSMHTQCEHDITISDTVGGDFFLANAAFGEVCTRITLSNCTFTKVRAKCLHITINNCQLSDFELNANKATIKNTNIRDFHFADKEARSGADQIVSEYADAGKITVDEGCSIFRAKDYTAGTTIGGWYSAVISGRISSVSDDTRFSVNYRDVARLKTDASYSETNLSISGVSREVDCRGATGKITNPAINAAFVAISSLDVPVGETHVFDVRDMDLKLNGAMRPYQYVSRDDSVRAYNALVSIGGGKFRSCLQAQVTDVGAKLTVLGIARTSDAYESGIETFVDSGNYAIKYEKGKVYNNSQTGNTPKWFDGAVFQNFS